MKFYVILLAAVLVSCGNARPFKDDTDGVEKNLKELTRPFEASLRALMETVREILYSGTDTIPVLDPLTLDNYYGFRLDITEASVDANFESINAINIGQFIVNNVNFAILRRRFDFSFTVPNLQISAENYNARGSIMNLNNLNGHGKAEVIFHNLTFAGFATVIPRDGFLMMDSCQIELDLEDFTSKFENLIQPGGVSDFINGVIANLVLDAVQIYKIPISSFINNIVTDTANTYLGEITLADLIDLIS